MGMKTKTKTQTQMGKMGNGAKYLKYDMHIELQKQLCSQQILAIIMRWARMEFNFAATKQSAFPCKACGMGLGGLGVSGFGFRTSGLDVGRGVCDTGQFRMGHCDFGKLRDRACTLKRTKPNRIEQNRGMSSPSPTAWFDEVQLERQKQTQFTPTLSTPETLQTRKAVPPSWTVVLCAISFWSRKNRRMVAGRNRAGEKEHKTKS